MYYFTYEIATGRITQAQDFAFAQVETGSSVVETTVWPDLARQRYSQQRGIYTRDDHDQYQHNLSLAGIRQRRNRRLAESDWTQMPDVPLSAEQKSAWQTHRQALRDITATLPDMMPENYQPSWPIPPSD